MRRSMRRCLVGGVLVAVLASCGGGGGDSDDAAGTTTEPKATETAEADRDATLTYVSSTGPGGWDPASGRNQYQDTLFMTNVYDRLVLLNREGEIDPMLATEWEFSDDGKTITFALRDGVMFHDGTPLTAESVAQSIMRGKTLPGSSVAHQLTNVTAVEAPDPETVVVTLAQPEPAILYILASTAGMVISPAGLDGSHDLQTTPAGSGPYMLQSSDASSATFVRNDDYFDPSANLTKIRRMQGILEIDARLNAVRSGQADIGQLSANEWPTIQSMVDSGNFEVAEYPSTNVVPMHLNTKIKPLDDPRVRLALNLAIDRNLINETLMHGKCPPTSQTFQPGIVGHLPDLEYDYDLERAKELLTEAGVGDGFAIKFLGTGTEPVATFRTAVRDMLAKLNITLDVTMVEPAAARATFRAGEYGGVINALSTLSPDPSAYVNAVYLGPDNPGGASEELASKANAASALPLGSDERREAYEEINQMMFDEPTHVWICQSPQLYVHSKKVIGADRLAYSSLAPIADIRFLGISK